MKTQNQAQFTPGPWTQEQCDEANTLREYERAHKRWMNLSVFTPEGQQARYDMLCARDQYVKAKKAAHPSWIIC